MAGFRLHGPGDTPIAALSYRQNLNRPQPMTDELPAKALSQSNKTGLRNAIVYNLPPFPALVSDVPTMLDLICLLKNRHESVLSASKNGDAAGRRLLAENLQSLAFAEAFFERLEVQRDCTDHPLQIAVLGPTQAGKSTIINALLQSKVAEPSPLAGYTIHPQGFCVDVEPKLTAWAGQYFKAYHQMPREALPRDRYDCWTLDTISVGEGNPLSGKMLWDTPDFDSVDAAAYQSAVLRVAALADVVLLVLSKDKYADLAVWKLLKLLEPLAQPTLVCLNKLEPASRTTITESLRRKWQDTRRDPLPTIVPVPYIENLDSGEPTTLDHERALLWSALKQARGQVQRNRQSERARVLVSLHRDHWLAPLRAEHQWSREWRELIDVTRNEGIAYYRSGYLDHPQHYETFRQALRELLRLLEIPGLTGVLSGTREVVTWLPRQLLNLGQAVKSDGRAGEGSGEAWILRQAFQHQLTRLQEKVLEKRDDEGVYQGGWRELGTLLNTEKSSLIERFEANISRYITDFQSEIERTARALYEQLEKDPATLNGLRAARLSTDAAAVVLALYTAGLGLHDLVLAPAMLSLTTLLTETALGHYLDKAASQLKKAQADAVGRLFEEAVCTHLRQFPERLDQSRYFNIAPETLVAMETRFA